MMPIYEFECQDCKHSFSVLTSWRDKGKTTCPECHSSNLREHFAPFATTSGGGGSISIGGGGGSCSTGGG